MINGWVDGFTGTGTEMCTITDRTSFFSSFPSLLIWQGHLLMCMAQNTLIRSKNFILTGLGNYLTKLGNSSGMIPLPWIPLQMIGRSWSRYNEG